MNDITVQMHDILEDYSEVVVKKANQCGMAVAKEGAEKLKSSSPRNTGKYAKGWTFKKVNTNWLGSDEYVIYNKAKPYLTHLLEKGHAKRNGGRTRPQMHIKPVEEWVQEELPKMLTQKIGEK